MMRLIKLRIAFSLSILVVFGSNQALAFDSSYAGTEADRLRLPSFCQANSSVHPPPHYCSALNFINRYKSHFGNKTAQRFYLDSALDDLGYAFGHSSPTNPFWPEMHVQKGKLLAAAKRNVEAVSEFEQALQRNPNYVEAYVALSDLYQNTGQQSKSITVVEQALQRAPNNKSMQRRYKQLTGKVFTPPPLTAEQAAQIPPTPIPVVQAAATSGVSSTTTQPVPASSPVVVPEKIGSPTNPWCRFCTDSDQP
ncbi:tetratricopeptide repeat protein [Candidatus Nitrotoga sp. 1052]|uniref:tetratricopeptide repeat protein n=1 Tax=Candidatus Nitrotoga sp. 1052 TaxID=2886964 RepID=UPI001EF575D5|nr:tetratricopeptide repeat protein [Candidatus Nitrotoga sp. 1052]CAH1087188.1 Tetratricopeptide repeat-containing protein [Candidatus Nitrotoga sp. 1052]